jgi:hypothetical protein
LLSTLLRSEQGVFGVNRVLLPTYATAPLDNGQDLLEPAGRCPFVDVECDALELVINGTGAESAQ